MTPSSLLALTINPVLSWMETHLEVPSDARSKMMLLTIAQQESALKYRKQVGGPAVSWWQFESGGGVKGVLTHPNTAARAKKGCEFLCVPAVQADVYSAMVQNDILACMMARLLLLSDPKTLPSVDDAQAGWDYYIRNWRPGKPHPSKWLGYWNTSKETLGAKTIEA